MASIEIDSLALRRGEFQLQIPHLRVEAGTVLGLVGRNGAGKSTLLELLAGLIEPDRGGIRVLGLSPTGDAVALRRRLSWMSDDMPVLALPLAAHARFLSGFYPSWDAALVEGLFRRFELDPRKNLQRMSKGEATRARLALAMGPRPEVLLLDEPATGLDVPSRRALLAELLDLMQDERRVVVIASHQTDDVERVADRLLMLERGAVVGDGSVAALTGERRSLEEVLAGGAL